MFELTCYESTEAVEYAPDIGDNRERDEPFTVSILPATAADVRKVEERHGKQKPGQAVNYVERHHAIRFELLRKYVKSISGLRVRTGVGEAEEIVTVERLNAVAPDALLDDIAKAIQDHSKLDEGVKKP